MSIGAISFQQPTQYAESQNTATFALSNGLTIILTVDSGPQLTVTFLTAEFVSIGAATANEVAAVFNEYFAQNGVKAYATALASGAVQITSTDDGPVVVVGGTAASVFDFESFSFLSDDAGAQPSAPTFHDRISFAGDSSYPSNGTPGFTALFNAVTKDQRKPLAVIAQDCGDGAYWVAYDEVNDKLKVFSVQTHTEVANATNLSAVTFNVLVVSR